MSTGTPLYILEEVVRQALDSIDLASSRADLTARLENGLGQLRGYYVAGGCMTLQRHAAEARLIAQASQCASKLSGPQGAP